MRHPCEYVDDSVSKHMQRDNSEACKRRIGLSRPCNDPQFTGRDGYHTEVVAWEQYGCGRAIGFITSREVPASTPKMAASQTHAASNAFEVVGVRKVAQTVETGAHL
jgi:hypothetical protein